ncbi:MAG: response regulator [Bacteroidota bacterium]
MEETIIAEPVAVSSPSVGVKEFNILYVDDESVNLRLFEMAFKRYYNVFIAEGGEQAKKILAENDIHLIVTDQKMPQMTGTQLLESIASEYPDTVRIILTGYADMEAIVQAINKCKIYKYITKPYDQSDMKLTLDKALELFKVKQEKKGLLKELAEINRGLEEIVMERTSELQDLNHRMMDGLKFAKTIVEYTLPKEQELAEVFRDAFVIYRPKDMVGGDFYWFKSITVEGRRIDVLAVVDCMGHGVAGALLSMIGDTRLNQIVTDAREPQADNILKLLDDGLRKSLARSESGATMDVTLTIIDREKGQLQFSGAKLDLIYFKGSQMERVRGTRKSIGSTWNENSGFTKEVIDLKDVNEFYLFSDGFQDQFNAENTKKFGTKQLLELISSTRNENLQIQKAMITDTFVEWKRDLEQVDDVTLIGVKL